MYGSAGHALKCKADVTKDIGIMFFCAWGLMLTFPYRLWMRLDTFAAPESPPEDMFEFFVHVYILSVPLTSLLLSPSSTICVQQDPGHFFE